MVFSIEVFIEALKIIAAVAVYFVWVVRYDNIKKEFSDYKLPEMFRDLVGILKISFTVMLQFDDNNLTNKTIEHRQGKLRIKPSFLL